jgi:hypothetical protein
MFRRSWLILLVGTLVFIGDPLVARPKETCGAKIKEWVINFFDKERVTTRIMLSGGPPSALIRDNPLIPESQHEDILMFDRHETVDFIHYRLNEFMRRSVVRHEILHSSHRKCQLKLDLKESVLTISNEFGKYDADLERVARTYLSSACYIDDRERERAPIVVRVRFEFEGDANSELLNLSRSILNWQEAFPP